MAKYIVKRLFYAIIVLFGVSVIIYFLVRLMPMDYVTQKFADKMSTGALSEADFEYIRELYGLSDNSFLGILKGYFSWLGNLLHGNLGTSFQYEMPVAEAISRNMWVSFTLSLIATILQFAIAIPLGIKAATHQYGVIDYTVTVIAMIGVSLPSFFLAALLMKVFAVNLGWLPLQGLVDASTDWIGNTFGKILDMGKHLILPMICLVILSIGGLMRHTRTNMLEVLSADYIRTARAKGLSERTVIYKHAFRNSSIPLVTMLAGLIASLFGGAMITEQVFSIPGIGNMAYTALRSGDVPFIMGYNMFLAVLTVLGTLLADIMYMVVDPRVKINR